MTLYSHILPDGNKLELDKHLHTVGEICANIVHNKKLNFEIKQNIIENLAYIIGISHDFGKATRYFQERLFKQKKSILTNHSKVSALFGYAMVSIYLREQFYDLSESWKRFIRLAVFYIIDRHHSFLYDFENTKEFQKIILQKQIKNLYKEVWKYNFQYNGFNFNFKNIQNDFNLEVLQNQIVRDFFEDEETVSNQNFNLEQRMEQIILLLFLFSILLEADKARLILEKEEYGEEFKEKELQFSLVDNYKKKKFVQAIPSQLNRLREKAYLDVTKQVSQIDLNKFIYSLNLPTGLGKTLTSLSFALRLRHRLGEKYKIIYSLPFLGIIEQTEDVFKDVFQELFNKYGQSLLLKHYSLSEIKYKSPVFDEEDVEKSEFLINIWNSKILLTTFDQVLYSIFSQDRSFLMRFHNLFNSIVIFDEIQSIPYKLWLLLAKFFGILSKVGRTYFILMTATKPLIFKENEINELIPNVSYYFNQLNRITLNSEIEKELSLNDFLVKIVTPIVNNNPKKDIMIVMNTINSSLIVYEFIKRNLNNKKELIYLSTNIIPKDRMARIEKIRQKRKKENLSRIIVTTQCIEAGVDIDADIILRDFAPLDCINQVCGRANRNDIKEKGEVWIYKLKDKTNNNYFSSNIYDSVLLNATEEVLKEKRKILEIEFLKLNREYFSKVKNRVAFNEAKEILENFNLMRFSKIDIRKLLRGDDDKIDVFVQKDEESKKILAEYRVALKIKDWRKRKKRLLDLKKNLFEYTISIYKRIKRIDKIYFSESLTNKIEEDGYYIDKEYYNDEIGFDPANILKDSMIIF